MKRWFLRWAHLIRFGHGRVVFYSLEHGKKRWTHDCAGRIYVCWCGKRWYD